VHPDDDESPSSYGQNQPPRMLAGYAGPRYTLFWPVMIFLVAFGIFTTYQLMNLGDQLDSVTQATDKIDAKVKRAEYERAKFYTLAYDVLRLAPTDPAARQVATQLDLQQAVTSETTQEIPLPTSPNAVPPPANTNSAPTTN
jgi:hypothetical protein